LLVGGKEKNIEHNSGFWFIIETEYLVRFVCSFIRIFSGLQCGEK
jgi:hypothetical protein